ncbi:MAG: PAS domain S-box protein [Actinobacteria bacterium]|nr:PAS domain S-box protein [Actinomycetota bacterium]
MTSDTMPDACHSSDSERRLSDYHGNVFERVPVAMYRTTPGGTILEANPALVDLLGYPTLEALQALDVRDLYVNPSEREECKKLLETQGVAIAFEAELLHFTGRTIWVHDNSQLVADAKGSVLFYEGALIDITARRRAIEGLQHAEERYRTLFDRSPVPLWEEDFSALFVWLDDLKRSGVSDLRRYLAEHPEQVYRGINLIRIVDVNEAAIALVAAESKDQLLGSIPIELLGPDGLQAFEEQIIGVWDNRRHLSIDVRGQTFTGTRIDCHLDWVETSREGEPRLSRVVVAITDNTAPEIDSDRLGFDPIIYGLEEAL